MSAIIVTVFFLCLLLIFYVYAGYPILAACVGFFRPRPIRKATGQEPFVTILIPAHNEESGIQETLENKLALDYPKERMEIVVVSDGSEDKTDEIVSSYADAGVTLLRQDPRGGKTKALNMAVPDIRGEIVVFSDANSLYSPNALKMLVRNFADPDVGYVTGKMIYTNSDGSTVGDGCSAYMKYENWLRRLETRVGSVVGVDGGIDAVRRSLYRPMSPDQLPDFILPLGVAEQGFRVVYEPEALLKEPALNEIRDESRMRVRVTLRALWALYDMRHLLSVRKYGMFAVQLWSHKLLRYVCFVFLAGAYASNLLLWNLHWFYRAFFLLQTAFYLGGALSPVLERTGMRIRPLYLARYFLLLNFSSATGFMKFLLGHKLVLWTPRKG